MPIIYPSLKNTPPVKLFPHGKVIRPIWKIKLCIFQDSLIKCWGPLKFYLSFLLKSLMNYQSLRNIFTSSKSSGWTIMPPPKKLFQVSPLNHWDSFKYWSWLFQNLQWWTIDGDIHYWDISTLKDHRKFDVHAVKIVTLCSVAYVGIATLYNVQSFDDPTLWHHGIIRVQMDVLSSEVQRPYNNNKKSFHTGSRLSHMLMTMFSIYDVIENYNYRF